MKTTSKLAVSLTLLLFTASTVAAAPALEIFSGDLHLNGNNIDNVGSLSVNKALTDGNISDAITLSSSASVDPAAITGSTANSGQVLEWNGSQWVAAADDDTDSQTLTVNNDTSQTNDEIQISNGNTVTVNDDYEADTQASAGTGLTKSSGTINVGAGAGLSAAADSLSVDTSQLAGTFLSVSNGNLTVNLGSDLTNDGSGNIVLASGSVAGSELASGAITESGGEIAPQAVNSTAIKNGAILDEDLSFTRVTSSDLLDAQDSGGDVATDISDLEFTASGAASVTVTGSNGGVATVDVSATDTDSNTTDISDSGTSVLADVTDVNFGTNLAVTGDGDGSVTVDATDTTDSDTDSEDQTLGYTADGTTSSGALTDTISITDGNGTQIDSINFDDDYEADTNTQLDDQQASSNVNMGGNNVTNTQSLEVSVTTGVTASTGCSTEGAIVYNGTHHLMCGDPDSDSNPTFQTMY